MNATQYYAPNNDRSGDEERHVCERLQPIIWKVVKKKQLEEQHYKV